jgi:Zn-dependent alcohol dehydrogenase
MRAAIFNGPHSITVGQRPDPTIVEPTDAIVRVALGCVCGSDLWYYRGESPHKVGSIGHEFIGTVVDLGPEVHGVAKGDLVVAPFVYCDMTCPHCLAGVTSHCVAGGSFGNGETDGGQGEAVPNLSPSGSHGRTILMAISETARKNHDEMFPGRVSALTVTDPELIEYFDNFAFDEVLR